MGCSCVRYCCQVLGPFSLLVVVYLHEFIAYYVSGISFFVLRFPLLNHLIWFASLCFPMMPRLNQKLFRMSDIFPQQISSSNKICVRLRRLMPFSCSVEVSFKRKSRKRSYICISSSPTGSTVHGDLPLWSRRRCDLAGRLHRCQLERGCVFFLLKCFPSFAFLSERSFCRLLNSTLAREKRAAANHPPSSTFFLALSAGSAHVPLPLDASGFPLFESAAAARYLHQRHGVPAEQV